MTRGFTYIVRTDARKRAIEDGRDRYNTGKPCAKGHESDRYTGSGKCVTCAAEDDRRRKGPRKYKPTVMERFEAMVSPEPMSGCWLWTGTISRAAGYGFFWVGDERGGRMLSHRASWVIHHGPIADGMHVCHKCDNRLCVNPEHLFLGTQADNMLDAVRKGRMSWKPDRKPMPDMSGANHPMAKLTEADVAAIRSGGMSNKLLASLYGVQAETISRIKSGKSWRSV